MRAVQISDWHLDARRQLAGGLREAGGMNVALTHTAGCVRAVAAAALQAGRVDLWLVTGDVTDTATPTQQEVRVMVELVEELAQSAPVVVIAGNHDVPSAGSGATALEALKLRPRIYVVEVPRILYFAPGLDVLELLDVDPFEAPRPGAYPHCSIAIACLPYPRRSELLAGAPEGSREDRYAVANAALRSITQAMRVSMETTAPQAFHVALFHGTIEGAVVGVQPRTIQGDIALTVGDFAGFDYAGAGHLHKMQRLAPSVYYAGSVDRVDFDEAADFKGGLDIQLDHGSRVGVKPIPSSPRRYVTLTPAEVEAYPYLPDVVYRVRASVTPEEAIEIRRQIGNVATRGIWIASALDVEARVRARDERATAEEPPSELLARWLDAHPEIVQDIVGAHGGSESGTRSEIIETTAGITGV